MPVPVCLRRPFMHLWTPVRAFLGRPYPYPCVRALGGIGLSCVPYLVCKGACVAQIAGDLPSAETVAAVRNQEGTVMSLLQQVVQCMNQLEE